MIGKINTALWFAHRPSHWEHAVALGVRKLRPDFDGPECRKRAHNWAAQRAVPVAEALLAVRLAGIGRDIPQLPADILNEGRKRAAACPVPMGGAGDVNLLYSAVLLSGACRVVETGVAYGWSSLAILGALEDREGAKLVSVDMPYPKMNNEDYVGIAVPERFRAHWDLVRMPDRPGLKIAIARAGGVIDLCHYDSDKSWWGRKYGYSLLWDALKPGGVFISDDIQDNMAFAEFVTSLSLDFSVTEFEGKFVGVARKPEPGR
jgi:predicted O-methyltransferase YrrM